ncbi:uncharacterized protein LOC121730698 [Aricia agestis]|uniref:uncharacterized protein LOC121730698 n=1 Tax=Aricia agestis TaxID=91739 RepID=UPI001C20BAD8|nr:uncharacterized protein LOC121730698 [Aricia agestis]
MYLQIFVFINFASSGTCWQYFTSLSDITLMGSPQQEMVIHSDYTFGDCKRPDIRLYAHVHKGHMDVLGKIIIREWLKIPRIPTCIVLRARSFEEDLFRSTAYNFQMCVPRIVYCHSRKRFKYFFYEWYIPTDMVGGMDWDIYFYGPIAMDWQ